MTVLETDRLDELIRAKHECLLQLRDAGLRQMELVHEGSMVDLLDLLAIKQRMLLDLQGIQRRLDPFRQQDPESRQWRSAEARQRCARRLEDCERLLAEILRQEKQSEQELTRRRDETALQLQGVHAAGAARGAYAQQVSHEPECHLDLTSDGV
jgi:hypothetical protein